MKKLQNNFTTIEQSRRLLELGVPADSADCTLKKRIEDGGYSVYWIAYIEDFIGPVKVDNILPCWSVGRLIEIYHICVSRGFSFNVCFPNLMNEIMYKLTEANNNGWLHLKKLEE